MRPIQKRLLIHKITYIKSVKDPWGSAKEKRTNVLNVRVQPSKIYVQGSTGENITSRDIIFWDSFYSTPCNFEEGQKVEFHGEIKTIQTISKFYDDDKLHHLEMVVI